MRTLGKWLVMFILTLAVGLPAGTAWAINADDLLDLLVEENVISSEKAQRLKKKVERLERTKKARETRERAQELQRLKQEVKTEAKAEAIKEAKKAVPRPTVEVGYKKGFYFKTLDDKFLMRMRLGIQPRFTYINRDKDVITQPMGTESNAYMKFRRLRLIFNGHAWKDYKYLIQVQLEPNQAVNVHDAFVYYGRYKFLQPWIGRGKIPYSLEFWQSGFKLNFVERSIFSGESDNHWPGVNRDFRGPAGSAGRGVGNRSYNTAGFDLYRSQGIMLMGDIDLWAPRNLRYWAGIWNGPNTRGIDDMRDAEFCYTGRLLFAPFPNGGPNNSELFMQGDYNYHKGWPMFYILGSMYTNRDKNRANRPGTAVAETFDTANHGFDLAACFKWRGFSLQAEWARETFTEFRPNTFIAGQFGQGHRTAHREAWYIAAGYFIIPKRFETVFRYAYANRVQNADNPYTWSYLSTNANQTNYLVPVDFPTNLAREGILREYTVGLNLYMHGHRNKYQVDYSRLIRDFYGGSAQEDNRFRFTAYWFF